MTEDHGGAHRHCCIKQKSHYTKCKLGNNKPVYGINRVFYMCGRVREDDYKMRYYISKYGKVSRISKVKFKRIISQSDVYFLGKNCMGCLVYEQRQVPSFLSLDLSKLQELKK